MAVNGIYGLSGSGIDVDSMVKVGMMSKQNEYDRMYKKEVKNEWIKEAYASVYSDLATFNNSTMSKYKMSATTSPMNAASSSSTVATAVANADAAIMSHTVTVDETSSNAYLLTKTTLNRANTSVLADKSIYLKDLVFDSAKQAEIKAKLDDAATGAEFAKKTAISFKIADGTTTESTEKTLSFTYEDIFNNNETLNDLVSKINNSGVNMRASYDSTNDAFSLYQKEGGSANQIILSAGTDTSLDENNNGQTLIKNLQLASVTVDTDSSGNKISKLSDLVDMSTTAGSGSVAANSMLVARLSTDSLSVTEETKLRDVLGDASLTGAANFKVAVGDGEAKEFSIEDMETATVKDFADAINNAGVGLTAKVGSDGTFAVYAKDGSKISLTSDSSSNATSILNKFGFQNIAASEKRMAATDKLSTFFTSAGDSNALKFTISDGGTPQEIAIADARTATVQDLLDKINAAGFNAKLSDAGEIEIATDSNKEITFGVSNSDSSGEAANSRAFINALGISSKELTSDSYGISAAGTDGKITIDGKEYTSTTGKVSVGNVTYTMLAKGTTTVSVTQDTDKIVENVKQFVEDYNKMIDELNNKYNETQYKDYGVLTKSQENGMTKEQIEKWNEKAKSGLLYHDQTIGKIISSMREAFYTPVASVDSSYNTMMSIGISSKTDRGHLQLDEDKLRKALSEDPDCVRQIFSSSGDEKTTLADGTVKTVTNYDKEGVINRIYDKLNASMKTMKAYAGTSTSASDGSTLDNLIRDMQTKMSNFKTLMDAFEKTLYKKYDAMESSIQQLTMQMNYITGGN